MGSAPPSQVVVGLLWTRSGLSINLVCVACSENNNPLTNSVFVEEHPSRLVSLRHFSLRFAVAGVKTIKVMWNAPGLCKPMLLKSPGQGFIFIIVDARK